MHEPAGVVEILVQILQNTPILKFRIPPPHPKKPNFQLFFLGPNPKFQNPPPSQNSKFPTFFPKSQSEVPESPQKLNLTGSPALIASEYPPQGVQL